MSPEQLEAVRGVWTASLVVFLVVTAVVTVLLQLVLRTARRIQDGVQAIWNTGQRIAGNTVHIALLDRTLAAGRAILRGAGRIAGATGAIRGHAEGCPGCPACVLDARWTP